MICSGYVTSGGKHPETCVLKNILAFHHVRAPHSGQPFSEAMLLGIGGGLGMGYILWEFEDKNFRALALGFRNNWQYPVKFMSNLCRRLNLQMKVHETAGAQKAAENLHRQLTAGQPVMAWVGLGGLSYRLPAAGGHRGHVVGVFGLNAADGNLLIDDLSVRPFIISADQFAAARSAIPSYKNRLITVRPGDGIHLAKAIWEGIGECVTHLSKSSTSFSLPAIKKWAQMLTDEKNPKSWPQVYRDGRGLFNALESVFEGTCPVSPSGGCLRDLYAEFLEEAAAVVQRPGLIEAAHRYRELAGLWVSLGEAALPDEHSLFSRIKELSYELQELLQAHGPAGFSQAQRLSEQLNHLRSGLNRSIPLNRKETNELFQEMQERLLVIYDKEQQALRALQAAIA